MGEFSKLVGEIGEEIVIDFLSLIGWQNPQRNFDIPSINPEKHAKKTHGIDAFFHYRSPMITNTLENILISTKFSKDKYRNDPVKQFKDYYSDIAMAIESFKRSELRNDTINKHSNLNSTFDRGILFWINNISEDRIDLSQKLLKIEIPKGFVHDGILLMDNIRVEFIFDSIKFVKNKFYSNDIQFTYFNSGLNNDDQSSKNGSVLPFSYLASNILPLRVQGTGNEVTFVICTKEQFEENELIKLMGLAKNIGANLQTNTILAFPDYNRLLHEQIVNNTKQVFEDSSFTTRLSIENYNTSFRG